MNHEITFIAIPTDTQTFYGLGSNILYTLSAKKSLHTLLTYNIATEKQIVRVLIIH